MTKNERNLWIAVGLVILGTLGYQLIFGLMESASTDVAGSRVDLVNAKRLLREENNIINRQHAAREARLKLGSRFLGIQDPETAETELLATVEQMAESCGLTIQSKNTIRVENKMIGVTLEGKTSSESFIRFLYTVTTGNCPVQIKRCQIHSLPDKAVLSYQVSLVSLLVDKDGE